MQKRWWLVFAIVGFLVAYAFPQVQTGVNDFANKRVWPALGNIVTSIKNSHTWQTYFTSWSSAFIGGMISMGILAVLAYIMFGRARARYRIWRAPAITPTTTSPLQRPAPTYAPSATSKAEPTPTPAPTSNPPPTEPTPTATLAKEELEKKTEEKTK